MPRIICNLLHGEGKKLPSHVVTTMNKGIERRCEDVRVKVIQNLQIITPGHPSVSPQQPEQFLSTVSFRLTIGWPMKTSSSASPQPVIYDRFPPLSGWSLCRPIHRYRPPGIPSTIKYFLRYLFQSLFFQFIFQHLLQFR